MAITCSYPTVGSVLYWRRKKCYIGQLANSKYGQSVAYIKVLWHKKIGLSLWPEVGFNASSTTPKCMSSVSLFPPLKM